MAVLQRTLSVDASIGPAFRADVVVETWRVVDSETGPTRSLGTPVMVPLTHTDGTYSAAIPDATYLGDSAQLVRRYLVTAIQDVALESLTSHLTVSCRTRSGQLAGTAEVSALVLPARVARVDTDQPVDDSGLDRRLMGVRAEMRAAEPARLVDSGLFFADADLVATELAGVPRDLATLRLQLLCLSTVLDAGIPRFAPPDDAELERLGDEGKKALAWVRKFWEQLTDIAVTFSEPEVLTIAGTLGVTGGDDDVTAQDFAFLRVVAEWTDADGTAVVETRSFDEAVQVTDDRVAFDFSQDPPVLQASVPGPVRVSVRGLTGTRLFNRTYQSDDDALADLELSVPRQLTGDLETPSTPVSDPNLRLRGRVLTLGKTCPSAKVTVLVTAKTADDDPWRVVGAATADAGGNFTMPYPFGTYVAAEAVCSLAPDEEADIPIVAESGEVTISTDFLWLAIRDPQVPDKPCGGRADGACPCGIGDSPSRVPDYSQVIGNDDYSQDLGSGCINLSKPNRTINEFRYQAIVRTSDPDVATYALERHELPLDSVDPRLTEQVKATVEAYRLHVASVRDAFPPDVSVFSAHTNAWLVRCYQHVVDAQRELNAGSGLVLDGLAAGRSHMEAIAGLVEAAQAQRVVDDIGPALSLEEVKSGALSLEELLTTAVDAAGTSVRYELRGATGVRERPTVSLASPIDWQGAPGAGSAAGAIGTASLGSDRPRAAEVEEQDPRPVPARRGPRARVGRVRAGGERGHGARPALQGALQGGRVLPG